MSNDPKFYDIAIIGGGACGLAASVFAARLAEGRYSVALIEKSARVGRKLLATGNGTCNLSNSGIVLRRYHGTNSDFAKPALDSFKPENTVVFFTSIGVACVEREDGRIYPLCTQAGAVLDCLRLESNALGVHEICDTAVTNMVYHPSGFILSAGDGEIHAETVLVCTGGAAAPSLGGSADAYKLLTALGHTRTPLFPSIVQVRTETEYIKSVKGVRVDALISFERDGKRLASEKGEVLFTEYGLSGPAVMQISRVVSDWERRKQGEMKAVLNLLPDMKYDELMMSLRQRASLRGRSMGDFLTGLLQKRLGQTLLRAAGYGDFGKPVSALQDADIHNIADAISLWEINVTGTQGMGGAQVTAGGIATGEFDPDTMQSRLVPKLYAAGEVLDIDGDCGGFNLQWAWASSCAAANAMIASLDRKQQKRGTK